MTEPAAEVRARAWGIWVAVIGAIATVLTWIAGFLVQLLVLGLFAHAGVGIVRRVVALVRRRWWLGWWRRPWARQHRGELARWLVNWALLAAIALVLDAAILYEALGDDAAEVRDTLVVLLVAAALLELVPTAPPRRATTVTVALVAGFLAVGLGMTWREPRDGAVVLDLPMAEELLVVQGGTSPIVNHHYLVGSQRHAIDLVVLDHGRMRHDGEGLHASPCFGTPIVAPAAGRVARTRDGLADSPIGETDREHLTGNQVVIEIAPERFVLLAHLRQGSVRVKPGDAVTCGQPIAECGNSGNTTEPHLHLQMQDRPDLGKDVTTFPIWFRHAERTRGGERTRAALAGVRRRDRLRSIAACDR